MQNTLQRISLIGSNFVHLATLAVLLFVALIGEARAENAAVAPQRTVAQLEQLVAPIALYPDALLSQILMASTYPLEVVEAARWAQNNPTMQGQALETAMGEQPWDPSVKALTTVPQTLQMMNEKIDWTQQLGDAFLAQQSDMLDAVQRLRALADANGQLKSTPEQKVSTSPRTPGQQVPAGALANVYVIEPTNPDQYYVPVYDPGTVYGAWPYPAYEPFSWYPPGYIAGGAVSFAAGLFVGSAIWGNVDWFRNRVGINPLRYNSFNRTNITNANWVHNPAHRGAVPYRDRNVAQQFGNQGNSAAREAFRGKAETGRQQLTKQGTTGAKNTAKGKQAARTDRTAGGKQGAGSKKSAAGSKQGAGSKKSAAGTKKAASAKQQASKQAGRPKQTAGTKKQGAGTRQVARSPSAGHRPSTRGNPGAHSRAQGIGRSGGGFGGARGGAIRGGGGGGGRGRRSDITLKHDIIFLGRLDNGLGFYHFKYHGNDKAYVGVLAHEVQTIMPEAAIRGQDGYLRVLYNKLGLSFQTYDQWVASGARIPGAGQSR